MATYNQISNSWTVSLGQNGTTTLFLSEITANTEAVRYKIYNTPTQEHLDNLNAVINNVYEPVCQFYGIKIPILPSYFGQDLINFLSIDKTNMHCYGQAIDLDVKPLKRNITNRELFLYVKNNIETDQLIWEFGNDYQPEWVHISYVFEKNRGQVLILEKYGQNFRLYELPPVIYNGLTT